MNFTEDVINEFLIPVLVPSKDLLDADACCSGLVAEKTDSELFFVDKNAVTCGTSDGECTDCWSEVFF